MIREPEARGLGWRPDTPDHRDHRFTASRIGSALPTTIDLRNLFAPVYDQLKVSSCVFNSISAVVQYNFRREKLPDFLPSRLFSYYNTRVIEGTAESDAGAEIRDGIKSVIDTGVCSEDAWPYKPANLFIKPNAQCYANARHRLITKYQRVDQTLDGIRSCLAGGDPVIFGFSVYEFFDSEEMADTGILQMPGQDRMAGGHAVVLCGYNDDTQLFLVRNSWGADWGLPTARGHFRMPYEYVISPDLASDFWTIQSVTAN